MSTLVALGRRWCWLMLGFFLGLVVIAQVKHPIPSRTRQLSTVAPMVLRLKAWESRSPPNLVRNLSKYLSTMFNTKQPPFGAAFLCLGGSADDTQRCNLDSKLSATGPVCFQCDCELGNPMYGCAHRFSTLHLRRDCNPLTRRIRTAVGNNGFPLAKPKTQISANANRHRPRTLCHKFLLYS